MLQELYQDLIVDHGKQPRNFGKLSELAHYHCGHNPLCGDQLTIYLHEEAGIIKDVKFEGKGCAISMASASLMTEAVKGHHQETVYLLVEHFHQMVTTGNMPDRDMGKLAAFVGVSAYPSRVKCATLAWHTLKAALKNESDPVCTEGEG